MIDESQAQMTDKTNRHGWRTPHQPPPPTSLPRSLESQATRYKVGLVNPAFWVTSIL